jgi:xylulokinase
MRSAYLGIDIGSSELRAGLVTADGEALGIVRVPHAMTTHLSVGHAEQDAEAWWRGLREAVAGLIAGDDIRIEAIGVDGHGPTLCPTDSDGRPTRAAITWLDQRASAEAAELESLTGLSGWALGVLPLGLWLERNEPAVAARTAWYLNSWESLATRLTGVAHMSLAPGQVWPSEAVLTSAGFPAGRIPPRVPAGTVVGSLRTAAAAELGLDEGVPVVAGLVDAFASFHGAGMTGPGDAIDVGGSAGGFGVYWHERVAVAGSFVTPAPLPNLYSVGGAMATTGKALDWFAREILDSGLGTAALIDEAARIEPGAGGLVFLPYLAGERSPIWDPDARGAFVGLTLEHDRAHLARAVLEAAAYAIRHVAEPMLAAGVRVEAMRVAGTPARSEAWNQLKADITGFPVAVPAVLETAIVGSAILAATGVGTFPDVAAAIRAMTRLERRLEPDPATRMAYDRTYAAYRELYPALRPVLATLAGVPLAAR